MQAMNDNAFYFGTPEELWRASQAWLGNGHEEQSEWLHGMAVDLIEIRGLPTTDEPIVRLPSGLPVTLSTAARLEAFDAPSPRPPEDIPF